MIILVVYRSSSEKQLVKILSNRKYNYCWL